MNDWLQELKKGDEVILETTGLNSSSVIRVVERTTRTQVILEGKQTRHRVSDGRSISSSDWSTSYILEATPERVELVKTSRRRAMLLRRVNRFDLERCSLGDLERIYKILHGTLLRGKKR